MCIQPTYEELKHYERTLLLPRLSSDGIQPTYEELETGQENTRRRLHRIQPTYEELKPT